MTTSIGRQTIHHADMQELLPTLPAASFGAIIADPPYSRKALPLYRSLLAEAGRLLAPGGNLLVILPQWGLPDIMVMPTPGISWRWLLNMRQTVGSYPCLPNAMRCIRVTGKQIGWWTKKPWPERDFRHLFDGFDNTPLPKERRRHRWQQGEDWANYCLANFALPGLPVLDPMVGAGTTLWCAERLGIAGVGIELDAGTYAMACAAIREESAHADQADARRRP